METASNIQKYKCIQSGTEARLHETNNFFRPQHESQATVMHAVIYLVHLPSMNQV